MINYRRAIFIAMMPSMLAFAACSSGGNSDSSAIPARQSTGSQIVTDSAENRSTSASNVRPTMPLPFSYVKDRTGVFRPIDSAGHPVTVVVPVKTFAVALGGKTPPPPVIPQGSWPTAKPLPTPTAHPTVRPSPTINPCRPVCQQITPFDQITGDDAGGQEGYTVNGGSSGGDGGFYVAHEALSNVYINPPQANDPQQYAAAYAPTTHGPNGNCFEVTTMYETGLWNTPVGTTQEYLALWNFCDNGGNWDDYIPMDSSFFKNYVTTFSNGNGKPEFVISVLLGSDNAWHYYIWNMSNPSAPYWEQRYVSAPGQTTNFNGGQGWSMFETHFAMGACSNLATSMSGLRYHNSSGWQYASMDNTFGYGSCFQNADDSGYPFYGMDFPSADWGWNSFYYPGTGPISG